MNLGSKVTTCFTPFRTAGPIKTIVYEGKWVKKGDNWYFHLDMPILHSGITVSEGFPLIYKTDRVSSGGFIVGWNSDDTALYIPTKDALNSTEILI